eukprot:SM000117S25481  [mRNA]  locus=s117:30096:31964:- [translate_table: standard]
MPRLTRAIFCRVALVPLFNSLANGTLAAADMEELVQTLHGNEGLSRLRLSSRQGGDPRHDENFYANPYPGCICKIEGSKDTHFKSNCTTPGDLCHMSTHKFHRTLDMRRLGKLFMYLIRPVPVVFLRIAFTLQLSAEDTRLITGGPLKPGDPMMSQSS